MDEYIMGAFSSGHAYGFTPATPLYRCFRTRTRSNTTPIGTEANAAGRSENARVQRKQSKYGMIQEGEGHWPNSSKKMQKARYLWVLRRANKEALDMRNTRSTRQVTEYLSARKAPIAVSGVAVNRKAPTQK